MLKKLSGWHRLFIVFVGVWSVMCIGALSYNLYTYNVNVPYPTIEDTEAVFELLKELENLERNADGKGKYWNAQELHKATIRNYYKVRRSQIFYFLGAWLVHIGFVYGMVWTTWWIIRGLRKEKK
jgi:hypothetical protein